MEEEIEEIWVPVPIEDFANLYEISNLGRCRNSREKILTPVNRECAYYKFYINRLMRSYQVHRLVACAFLGDIDDSMNRKIVHIDGDKFNNKVENLKWYVDELYGEIWESVPVPYYEDLYEISNLGRCRNSLSKNILTESNTNYSRVKLWKHGESTIYMVNKLVACAFVELEGYDSDRRIIHKDGNRFNNKAENLEWFVDELDGEIWVPFSDDKYAKLYEVSNLGRCRSLLTKEIRKYDLINGYHVINVWKNNKSESFSVHRIIACAFVDDPTNDANKDTPNHIDGNKLNNKSDNLEWVTGSGNSRHAHDVLGIKKFTRPIIKIDEEGEETEYSSTVEAANETGLTISTITHCLRGRQSKAGGFEWKYVEESDGEPDEKDLENMVEIPNYPNYLINEEGKIYSKKKYKFIKPDLKPDYPTISLHGKNKEFIHRLVAETFIPNPKNLPQVNHIDHNKLNYHVDNLEWVTAKQNKKKYQDFKNKN
jgi:hypothetical protein